jgi:2-dehydro-3-deoxyphosphooctonate aldolase (KDO 8-P synthase)
MPHPNAFELAPTVLLGGEKPVLIAGPCVIESEKLILETASRLKQIAETLHLPFIFKSSFDKANRTSGKTFRSLGFQESLAILQKVREELQVPVLTDVHECVQVNDVAKVVDVLQIPAFLCRQTDLLQICALSMKPVNIKKGQFMAPEDMQHAVEKAKETGNDKICLTERGSSFGYHTLVVDMRAMPIMRQFAPVIFDCTHSVQQPGGMGGKSGGQREFVSPLSRAAAAVGVDGFFVETHPNPETALSDGPNMLPLDRMPAFLETLLAIHRVVQ